MRNLPPDELAGGASYISGSHKPLYMMQGLDGSFDAVLFVSYHGSVGAPAGLSHTYNPRAVVEARLDGAVTGEAGINALVAAHYGVPVVLVTGDRVRVRGDRRADPRRARRGRQGARSAGLAAHSLHPVPGLRADPGDRREGGRRGGRAPSRRRSPPAALEISVRTTDIAEAASWVRGVERTGPRELRISGEDPLAIYRSFCAAILLTRSDSRRSCDRWRGGRPGPGRRRHRRGGRDRLGDLPAAGRRRVRGRLPRRPRRGPESGLVAGEPARRPRLRARTCATRTRCTRPPSGSGPTSGRRGCWSTRPGCSASSALTELDEGEWDRIVDTNLKGPFLTCREFLPGHD